MTTIPKQKSTEKLTDSGAKCNNYIYFQFGAAYFETEKVTMALRIEPTSVRIKKEPVPKSTTWKYQINVGDEIDLETPLGKLIDIFEPKMEEIKRLKEKYNLETRVQFVIDIDINPESSTPFFFLNKRTINFLNKTETEVDFDLYKADPIGILESSCNPRRTRIASDTIRGK